MQRPYVLQFTIITYVLFNLSYPMCTPQVGAIHQPVIQFIRNKQQFKIMNVIFLG